MATPARQRILDAALGLIQQKGIGRVTTREIALAAGAAEGCAAPAGRRWMIPKQLIGARTARSIV
jgi:hypothetical protein